MGRGNLTTLEVEELIKNPHVEKVTNNRILYTEEFKLHFLKEYYGGKKPARIFREAGFDIAILGSKRIERCSAHWREANASGLLGEKYAENTFFDNCNKTDNEITLLNRKIKAQEEEISELKEYIKKLEQQNNLTACSS